MITENTDLRAQTLSADSAMDGSLHVTPQPSKRGFAAMDAGRQRDIASKGGSSVPVDKRSFSRNRELAIAAGRKGGQARMLAAQRRKALAAAASDITLKQTGHAFPPVAD
jgi:uncharacterized protein